MAKPARPGEEERLARAELGDEDWEWARHKSLLKEAISEWVEENPAEGKQMVTNAIASYIDGLVKAQLQSIGKWTLTGLCGLLVALLLWLWVKSGGFKI